MSDPYNQYPSQYGGSPHPQGSNYGAPPVPTYGQQQGGPQGQAPYQNQSPYPPQQSPYEPPQPGYGTPQPSYNGYGPPQHGGFQHGQQNPYPTDQSQQQYGGYQSPPPTTGGYQDPRDQYPGQAPSQQFPQQGAYNQNPYPADNNAPGGAQEGDRGLLGAMAGGAAGYWGGNKKGHGVLGALAGAFAGHKLEDKFKGKNGHGKY